MGRRRGLLVPIPSDAAFSQAPTKQKRRPDQGRRFVFIPTQ